MAVRLPLRRQAEAAGLWGLPDGFVGPGKTAERGCQTLAGPWARPGGREEAPGGGSGQCPNISCHRRGVCRQTEARGSVGRDHRKSRMAPYLCERAVRRRAASPDLGPVDPEGPSVARGTGKIRISTPAPIHGRQRIQIRHRHSPRGHRSNLRTARRAYAGEGQATRSDRRPWTFWCFASRCRRVRWPTRHPHCSSIARSPVSTTRGIEISRMARV